MNSSTNHEIDAIVQLVIDRLRDRALVDGFASVTPVAGDQSIWQFDRRLLTLKEVDGQLSGIQSVVVSADCVITPAVRDELRLRKIELRRSNERSQASLPDRKQAQSGVYCVIAAADKVRVIQSLSKIDIEAVANGDATSVARELASRQSAFRAVWCTPEPFSASVVCASELGPFRFVSLHQTSDLRLAVSQVNPNLLLLDDNRWTGLQVVHLLQAWSRIGKAETLA